MTKAVAGGATVLAMWILFVSALTATAATLPTDLQERCDRGEAQACVDLGAAYLHGEGKPKDPFRAAQLFRGACEADNAHACMFLAEAYRKGEGLGTDAMQALDFYTKACDLGDGLACRSVGDLYILGNAGRSDGRTAGLWYRMGCDMGDGPACTAAGLWMERGDVMDADPKGAVNLFRAGCERGHTRGCTQIGIRYAKGASGLKRDLETAASWFERSCPAVGDGDPEGCREIGRMMVKGKGRAEDIDGGKVRLERACFQNDHLGCRYLAEVELALDHLPEAMVASQRGCDLGDTASCRKQERVQFKLMTQ